MREWKVFIIGVLLGMCLMFVTGAIYIDKHNLKYQISSSNDGVHVINAKTADLKFIGGGVVFDYGSVESPRLVVQRLKQ